jgi:hypothetical protein
MRQARINTQNKMVFTLEFTDNSFYAARQNSGTVDPRGLPWQSHSLDAWGPGKVAKGTPTLGGVYTRTAPPGESSIKIVLPRQRKLQCAKMTRKGKNRWY